MCAIAAARRADRTPEHRRRVAIAVLVVVLASYVAGAVMATAAGAEPALLVVPGIVVAGCAAMSATSASAPPDVDAEADQLPEATQYHLIHLVTRSHDPA